MSGFCSSDCRYLRLLGCSPQLLQCYCGSLEHVYREQHHTLQWWCYPNKWHVDFCYCPLCLWSTTHSRVEIRFPLNSIFITCWPHGDVKDRKPLSPSSVMDVLRGVSLLSRGHKRCQCRLEEGAFIWIPEDLQQQIQEGSSSPVALHNSPPPPNALRVSPCPHLSTDTMQSNPLERQLTDSSLKATRAAVCPEWGNGYYFTTGSV